MPYTVPGGMSETVRNYVRIVFQGGDHSKKVHLYVYCCFFGDGIAYYVFHTYLLLYLFIFDIKEHIVFYDCL